MNNHGHAQTTTAALEALPAWEQAIWAPEKRNLAEVYSLYGDTYALDKKGIGPYVEFPEGDIPDFYMTRFRWKRHYDAAVDYWEFPFHARALRTLDHFMGRIVDALRAGSIVDAARFAGTMAHYVEDHACPGHALDDTDLEIVKDLLPPPERLRLLPFHSMMEKSPAPFSLDGHAPRLYGTLIPQASANFAEDVPESLGATPLYEHVFQVPAGVYRKFSTDYGVHATLGANQPIVFEVWCDERLLFQDVRRAGEAAGSATLDWPGDGTQLRLVATVGADAPVKRINGRPVSFAGHAVWGRPRLVDGTPV